MAWVPTRTNLVAPTATSSLSLVTSVSSALPATSSADASFRTVASSTCRAAPRRAVPCAGVVRRGGCNAGVRCDAARQGGATASSAMSA